MGKELVSDAEEVMKAAQKLLVDVSKFIEENIIKIKIEEGPLLKVARKEVAKGLRNIADVVEDPSKKVTWIDIEKEKKPKK